MGGEGILPRTNSRAFRAESRVIGEGEGRGILLRIDGEGRRRHI